MTDTYVGAIDSVSLLVQFSDGGSPAVYSQPCLINLNRSLSLTAQTTSQVVANCTDPTKPGKTIRTTVSTDSTISGDGKLDRAAAAAWAAKLGQKLDIKAQAGSVTGDLLVSGPYILEEFTIQGAGLGELVTASIKLSQADAPTLGAVA